MKTLNTHTYGLFDGQVILLHGINFCSIVFRATARFRITVRLCPHPPLRNNNIINTKRNDDDFLFHSSEEERTTWIQATKIEEIQVMG